MTIRFSKWITFLPGLRFNIRNNYITPNYYYNSDEEEFTRLKMYIDENYQLQFKVMYGENPSAATLKKIKQQHKIKIHHFLNQYATQFNQELNLCINQYLLTPNLGDKILQFPNFVLLQPQKPHYKEESPVSKLLNLQTIKKYNKLLDAHYKQAFLLWQQQKQTYLFQKKNYLEQLYRAQTGNVIAMEKIMQELLNTIQWEKETQVFYKIINKQELLIDIDLPEIEDIPNKVAKAIERGLKLAIKLKTPKENKLDYMQSIFSILFRITGVLFAALPTINKITISGFTQRFDYTGCLKDNYIVSAIVNKNKWRQLNFKNLMHIVPYTVFKMFELKCNVDKQNNFEEIQPYRNIYK